MKIKYPKILLVFFALCTLVFITACGCHKKTEREQYESATSSLKYKTYKKLSENAFPAVFNTYNSEAPDSLKVSEEAGRLVLGYFWVCSGKTTFGFAEGNIILDDSQENTYKSLAKLLIAIGMYENEWKELAKEESKDATQMLSKEPEGQYVEIELTTIHLLLATYAIKSRDFDAARFHMAGFANLTGIQWPHTLVDAMGDIEKGDVQTGLKKIKTMSKDESVPKEVRDVLAKAIEDVESKGGNVDSVFFWPRAIGLILYDELKKAAQPGMDQFMKQIDNVKGSVDD